MRVFRLVFDEGVKCGGCLWRVHSLYVLAESEEEAWELYKHGEAGLCGDCFSKMLADAGYEVKLPSKTS